MVVCGVEIKSKSAIFALATLNEGAGYHIPCQTKKIQMGNHEDAKVLEDMLATIKSFSHQNNVEMFVIKSRALSGMRAGGGVTFKIEALLQLSGTSVVFVSPQTLAKFSKSNLAGLPEGLNSYQHDAYRSAVYHLTAV